jgi:hypothetical protein
VQAVADFTLIFPLANPAGKVTEMEVVPWPPVITAPVGTVQT